MNSQIIKRALYLPFLFFCFLGFLNAEEFLVPPSMELGQMVPLVLWDSPLDSEINLSIYNTKGEIFQVLKAYPLELEKNSPSSFIAFLALSSNNLSGEYDIHCEVKSKEGVREYRTQIWAKPKSFSKETIALNSQMTKLRDHQTEQKKVQARELWAQLSTKNEALVQPCLPFELPLKSFIESAWYGDRRIYKYSNGKEASSTHNGVDLAAPIGTIIKAPLKGKVVMAQERIVTGNTVILEHFPGIYTLYYHLDSISVWEGETLFQGDLIGHVGSTGLVTGPHLHWEMRINEIPVDPMAYLTHPLIDKVKIMNMIDMTKEKGR